MSPEVPVDPGDAVSLKEEVRSILTSRIDAVVAIRISIEDALCWLGALTVCAFVFALAGCATKEISKPSWLDAELGTGSARR